MWRDDEQLLAALADAVHTARTVPGDFVAAGKAAYDWRTIDAELATLTYDSSAGPAAAEGELAGAGTRADPAVLRALTFASPRLAIELQIAAEALLGQIAPTAAGQVRAEPVSGAPTSAIIDDLGWFEIRPAPAMPFRLRLIISDGDDVLTGWITP